MVYLSEGCLGACYPGTLSLGEVMEMEREREVHGAMAIEQGEQSGHLSQGRMSTAGGKERAAAAGDAGEAAACPGSTMRLRD